MWFVFCHTGLKRHEIEYLEQTMIEAALDYSFRVTFNVFVHIQFNPSPIKKFAYSITI